MLELPVYVVGALAVFGVAALSGFGIFLGAVYALEAYALSKYTPWQ